MNDGEEGRGEGRSGRIWEKKKKKTKRHKYERELRASGGACQSCNLFDQQKYGSKGNLQISPRNKSIVSTLLLNKGHWDPLATSRDAVAELINSQQIAKDGLRDRITDQ